MSLQKNKVYVVKAGPITKLGYLYNQNYYGTHFTERGPIAIRDLELQGFSIGDMSITRLKDGFVFDVKEAAEEESESFVNSQTLI